MAGDNPNAQIRAWLRAHGENVSARGRIPADQLELYYAEYPDRRPPGAVRLLPGPDATDEDLDAWEDMGVIGPDSDGEPLEEPGGTDVPPEPREAATDGVGPAHGRKDWRRQAKTAGGKPRVTRVTAGIRGDIYAKISFALEIPGQIWRIRDPVCGGVFVEQRPEVAEALTDIVCDSPDLVAFFTGPGGSFMKYLKLAAALYPVGTTMMAHHVYHTIGEAPEDVQQPDYAEYAA